MRCIGGLLWFPPMPEGHLSKTAEALSGRIGGEELCGWRWLLFGGIGSRRPINRRRNKMILDGQLQSFEQCDLPADDPRKKGCSMRIFRGQSRRGWPVSRCLRSLSAAAKSTLTAPSNGPLGRSAVARDVHRLGRAGGQWETTPRGPYGDAVGPVLYDPGDRWPLPVTAGAPRGKRRT